MKEQGSALLTKELAERALDLATPTIEALLQCSKREENRRFVHVVILNPLKVSDVKEEILAQRTIGRAPIRSEWEKFYDVIAIAKARVAKRTGQNSAVVAAMNPALFQQEDTRYEGGVILGGIPAGGSGVESYLSVAFHFYIKGKPAE